MPLFTIEADGYPVAVIAADHQARAIRIVAAEWDNLTEAGAFHGSAKVSVRDAKPGEAAFWRGIVSMAVRDGELSNHAAAVGGHYIAFLASLNP